MKTKRDIEYHIGYGNQPVIIPKGTAVERAKNLPESGLYWTEKWEGMSEHAESWYRNYGFCLTENEVTE